MARPKEDYQSPSFNDLVWCTFPDCRESRMAVRLEPSGESPSGIADASKAFCANAQTAALNSSRDIKGGSATSIDEMERATTFYARAQVVAARICRKTTDCSLARVP
jgi:hypothetical protein